MDNPLVLIHGAGDSTRAWQEQMAYFGTRAHALDLPGHGTRADTLPETVRVEDYAQAVWTIIQTELRLAKPVIVGHSLGGLIALQMGLDFGASLGGLILIGTGARMRVHPTLLEAARSDPEQAQQVLRQSSLAPSNASVLSTRLAGEGNRAQSGMLYRDLMACNGFDVMNRLEELAKLPTLILCGEEERNAPVKYSRYLHEHMAASTLVIVPEAGHYVQRERPESVNRAIAEWLAAN